MKSPQPLTDSVGIRLYLLESDLLNVINDTTCPSCTPVTDAYSLGITQYSNTVNTVAENGTLLDDTAGAFIYWPYKSVAWVPFDNGYYAEIKTKPFSEFWLNNGGPLNTFAAGNDYLDFMAWRNGTYVSCYWHSLIDSSVAVYSVQWSLDPLNFATALDTPAMHVTVGNYSFNDYVNFNNHPVLYYRLKWTMTATDQVYYSPVRIIHGDDSALNNITFNVAMISHKSILTSWVSGLDGVVNHYLLDRAIGNEAYTTIDNAPSLHHFDQTYNFTDQPTRAINTGTLIHYRLTAVLEGGSTVVLPEKTVEWISNNTFLNIYPNPVHDGRFNIQWFADAGTIMHLSISDDLGRKLYETSLTSTQWNNTTALQTASLPHGVYFVRMVINGSVYTAKLVYE